jgi:hypothetical protein
VENKSCVQDSSVWSVLPASPGIRIWSACYGRAGGAWEPNVPTIAAYCGTQTWLPKPWNVFSYANLAVGELGAGGILYVFILLSNGYHELWILRYPAQRYHAMPSPGFEPTTLWFWVQHPIYLATMLHKVSVRDPDIERVNEVKLE